MAERFIITADPPTANGDLHIGHLSGPYFAADALTRFLRLKGAQVAFYSNSDPHQTYVVTTARRFQEKPQETVERFNRRIRATLEAGAIDLDLFGGSSGDKHAFAHRFFQDLYDRGELVQRKDLHPFCAGCQQFLFQAYIEGTCPHCGAGCFGNNCEACAQPNNPKDMGNAFCRFCGKPPSSYEERNTLYLPLGRHQEKIKSYLQSREGIYRPRLFEVVMPMLEAPLPEIPLTFVDDYGLPVLIEGFEDQIYNVRLELFAGLISTFDEWRGSRSEGRDWDWRTTEDYKVIHCHGIDNGFQYTVMFNALLAASNLGWKFPHNSLTNEFCLLDGRKFSTTRNYAIWGGDLLERVSSDHLRFYLALVNPETAETNFVLEEFRGTTDRVLVEPWNVLVDNVTKLLAEAGGRGGGEAPDEETTSWIDTFSHNMEQAFHLDRFSLKKGGEHLADALGQLTQRAVSAGNRAVDLKESGRLDHELGSILGGLRAWAVLSEPIVPQLADRLQHSLGMLKTWDARRGIVEALDSARWGTGLQLQKLAEVDLSGLTSNES